MAQQDQPVCYRLPRSVVRITGTVTIESTGAGEPEPKRTSDVVIATEAEPGDPCRLTLEEGWGRDREFDLKFTADQRVSGATNTSTGVGGRLIEAGVRVASLAAKLAPAFAAALEDAPENAPGRDALESAFESERPELAARRQAYKQAIDGLQGKLADVVAEVGGEDPPAAAADRVKAIAAALAAARDELALLDAEVDTWRAERFPVWTQALTYTIATDQLPARTGVEERTTFTDDELRGDARDAARKLGVVVARIRDRDPTGHSGPDESEGLLYRFPRRTRLAVYEEEPPQALAADRAQDPQPAQAAFRLRTLTSAWIVDSWSKVGVVRFKSGVFSKHGVTAEFGDAGTLSHLGNSDTSTAGTLADALSGAGGQIQESLDQAGKIAAVFPPAPDPRRKALQDEVEEKELEARLAKAKHTIATGNGGGAG